MGQIRPSKVPVPWINVVMVCNICTKLNWRGYAIETILLKFNQQNPTLPSDKRTNPMMTSSNGNIFRITGPFFRGIHQSPVNSPHKSQWRGTLMFLLICAWIKRLSKQSWGWWFETPSRSLWRHHNSQDHIIGGTTEMMRSHSRHMYLIISVGTKYITDELVNVRNCDIASDLISRG